MDTGAGGVVRKASEYLVHAQECRRLARKMATSEQRDQMLTMADNWEQLAQERARMVTAHPEIAQPDEAGRSIRPPTVQ